MLTWLAQLRYPKEFRIEKGTISHAQLQALIGALRASAASDSGSQSASVKLGLDVGQLAEVVTAMWRLREKLVEAQGDGESDRLRRARRHLEATWDMLVDAGIEVQDHSRSPYEPGLSIKVAAFQPYAELQREMIVETIKPTIYLRGQRVQMGEVIVGTPDTGASA